MQIQRVPKDEAWKGIVRRGLQLCLTLGILFIASATLQSLAPKQTIVEGAKTLGLQIDPEIVGTRAGSGLIFGIFGGFRTLAADITWLRQNEAWIDKDLAETEALIRLTVLIDPRPEVFWKTGAHTLAFDMPVWRINDRGGEEQVPKSIQKRIQREQMDRAIDLLKKGQALYPDNPTFPIEIGTIYVNRIQDYENTVKYWRKAWEMPGKPHHIGRLLARVLSDRLDRRDEALAVLRHDLATLPADDPEAFLGLVQERIYELELQAF